MRTFILLLLCTYTLGVSAQPITVLTGTNSNPVIGDTFYYHGCDTVGVTVSYTGMGITWNYSSLKVMEEDTISIVPCHSTAYCDSFPMNDFAEIRLRDSLYDYFVANTYKLMPVGEHSKDVGYVRDIHSASWLRYPLTYPGGWSDTTLYFYDDTYSPTHINLSMTNTIDGYGSLITPTGTVNNVLRLHNIQYIIDSDYTSGHLEVYNDRNDYYYWFTPGFHYPLLVVGTDNDMTTGATNYVYYTAYATGPALNTLSVINESKDGLKVFPNPAKDVLHISGANIKGVELMDMSGKILTTVDGRESITLSTSPLANGIYLLRVKTDDGDVMKKIVVGQ